jgi:hypothetical protein
LHVTRDATDAVLARIAAALAPGGFFLVSVREDGYRPRDGLDARRLQL